MITVANAGPLIALAQIGHLDLLQLLFGHLQIPPAVQEEVVRSGRGRPGAAEVNSVAWIRLTTIRHRTAVQLLQERLDAGESEAIVLALELGADLLLIDEARGRRVAEARGMAITGTLGILVRAKQQKLIPAVTPLLDELRSIGFRMGDELYQTAQELAGED